MLFCYLFNVIYSFMKIGDALNVFKLFLSIDNIHGRRRKWDRDMIEIIT
jgi:hypothetical protein